MMLAANSSSVICALAVDICLLTEFFLMLLMLYVYAANICPFAVDIMLASNFCSYSAHLQYVQGLDWY